MAGTKTKPVTPATVADTEDLFILKEKFADSKIPSMKKDSWKPYVNFGDKNDYPEYINFLANKSATHGAILNGKLTYIWGNGLKAETETPQTQIFLDRANETETWHELGLKLLSDKIKFGGLYVQVIPKAGGSGYNYYHLNFDRVRTDEEATCFYYKKDWTKYGEPTKYPAFVAGIKEACVIYVKGQKNQSEPYPLPDYVQACNWIESDIEVSKGVLTNAKSGFSASKFINFFDGIPTKDEQRSITRRINNAATGSDGIKVLVGFNNDTLKKPTVDDLGESDLTREDFEGVNNLIIGNIFTGHSITTPQLFGVPQKAGLGDAGASMKAGFKIFKKTYVNAEQKEFESFINKIAIIEGVQSKFKLTDIEELFDEVNLVDFKDRLPTKWVNEQLGIDATKYKDDNPVAEALQNVSPLLANKILESMTPNEIRAIVGLSPTADGAGLQTPSTTPTGTTVQQQSASNNVFITLTGRQQQQVMRIIRQHSKGQLNEKQAILMLTSGNMMSEVDAKVMLGIEEEAAQFAKQYDENDVALMFSECGQSRDNFTIVSSKSYREDDDEFQFMFAAVADLTELEKKVSDVLKKDSKITNENIAAALKIPVEQVNTIVDKLTTEGIISAATTNGIRKIIEPTGKSKLPDFQIMYSYEKRRDVAGAELLPTSRPFCVKLIGLDRLYTRKEIQGISQKLGYNVFNRAGGFWNNNGKNEEQCRHEWRSQIVIKKK